MSAWHGLSSSLRQGHNGPNGPLMWEVAHALGPGGGRAWESEGGRAEGSSGNSAWSQGLGSSGVELVSPGACRMGSASAPREPGHCMGMGAKALQGDV